MFRKELSDLPAGSQPDRDLIEDLFNYKVDMSCLLKFVRERDPDLKRYGQGFNISTSAFARAWDKLLDVNVSFFLPGLFP